MRTRETVQWKVVNGVWKPVFEYEEIRNPWLFKAKRKPGTEQLINERAETIATERYGKGFSELTDEEKVEVQNLARKDYYGDTYEEKEAKEEDDELEKDVSLIPSFAAGEWTEKQDLPKIAEETARITAEMQEQSKALTDAASKKDVSSAQAANAKIAELSKQLAQQQEEATKVMGELTRVVGQ